MRRGPWRHKVWLGDIWNDDDMSLPDKNEIIVARIRGSEWYIEAVTPPWEGRENEDDDYSPYDVEDIIDRLYDAGKDDQESEWNYMWNEFYDYCDQERIWVDLFTVDINEKIAKESRRTKLTERSFCDITRSYETLNLSLRVRVVSPHALD